MQKSLFCVEAIGTAEEMKSVGEGSSEESKIEKLTRYTVELKDQGGAGRGRGNYNKRK